MYKGSSFLRELIIIVIALAPGLALRAILAPYSTGSDIPQFAGFADTFLRHGLLFYRYADGSMWEEEGWAYNWPYVYGPVWIYILGLLRMFARAPVKHYWSQGNYYVYAPIDWIVAVKTILILFDTVSALLLYYIVQVITGRRSTSLLSLIVYYYNPMTIYISGIYGMFDPIALALALGSIILYQKRPLLSGALLGLALMTKHTMLYPALILLAYTLLYRRNTARRYYAGFIAGVLAPVAPFALAYPDSVGYMIKVMFFSSKPGYTYPIVYSFNGVSSLATYIHDKCGYDTLWLIENWLIPSAVMLAVVFLYMLATRDHLASASLAYIVFTATYWRVNHQYLVPSIAFLIILMIRTPKKSTAALAGATAALIGLWAIAFPTSWWFHAHIENPNHQLWHMVDAVTLMIFCDVFYVVYSLELTQLQYLTILAETWDKIIDGIIHVRSYLIRKIMSILGYMKNLYYTRHASIR